MPSSEYIIQFVVQHLVRVCRFMPILAALRLCRKHILLAHFARLRPPSREGHPRKCPEGASLGAPDTLPGVPGCADRSNHLPARSQTPATLCRLLLVPLVASMRKSFPTMTLEQRLKKAGGRKFK